MPVEIWLISLASFIGGMALGCALIYGCRYVGRKMSDRKEMK